LLPLFELDESDTTPLIDPENDPRVGSIAERAERFHQRNPHVYRFAVKIARFMKARGLRRYGIGAVFEIMRFKILETTGDIYKLNNNHRAFYARLIMGQEQDLGGFFSIRESPHDSDYYERRARRERG
jgi:hypothetical protein